MQVDGQSIEESEDNPAQRIAFPTLLNGEKGSVFQTITQVITWGNYLACGAFSYEIMMA